MSLVEVIKEQVKNPLFIGTMLTCCVDDIMAYKPTIKLRDMKRIIENVDRITFLNDLVV